ncbi:MAG: DUF1553 domain-containing protein [Verrucomicrobia bacterium]|nr:DUF1553 domain-containing protein [Verrucomicrobiota bacterium]
MLAAVLLSPAGAPALWGAAAVDFNRDVRRILSENCFQCHGPDAGAGGTKKALRLDLPEAALAPRGDRTAIVAGDPGRSELVRRIVTEDPDDHMPPPDSGKTLTQDEVALLKRWIAEGAAYSRHWAYVPPQRPELPAVQETAWPRNPVDRFILARLEAEGLKPSPEAEATTLVRRAALDLTGLPPTLEEADEFLRDREPQAFERLVDRLCRKEAYGEHWARLWLDQARYADSAGYSDDPARTIWGYRDYVIRSFNANQPFDQFTVEQIAGDLLPDPEDDQWVATAFHRNTMTNNEGGTNDEEYRNVALVDRVNTTMAVWMGTTMACAQCHNHKYDPITQEEYFRMFAILNNTADADRGDESPVHALFTPEQKRQRTAWESELAQLDTLLKTRTPELDRAQEAWELQFATDLAWEPLKPGQASSQAGAAVELEDDGAVRIARGGKTDTYTVGFPSASAQEITGLRLTALPEERPPGGGVGHADGNFVLTRVRAAVVSATPQAVAGRFLRIELPGREKYLSLAEVQIFQGTNNIARAGEARQSSTAYDGPARLAIDGNTDGDFSAARSTTHTEASTDPWWEVDLASERGVDRIVVWNRTDGVSERLRGFRVALLDEQRLPVWEQVVDAIPSPQRELRPDGARPVTFRLATASHTGQGFDAAAVIGNPDPAKNGWSVAPRLGEAHSLDLIPTAPFSVGPGSNLVVTLEQASQYEYATLARFRMSWTGDARAGEFARTPPDALAALRLPAASRSEVQRERIGTHFLSIAPALQSSRDQRVAVRKQLADLKPYTTVPITRELTGDQRRKTHLQRRGNWMDLGQEVTPGLPTAFPAVSGDTNGLDRMTLARWLVARENPLTARVVVNRLWESVFGIGLVRTSEEFGSQGEPPSHPELLDWLAVELMDHGWDVRHLLRLMVTSATYRQSSRVTPELVAKDPENRLLARGPRYRLSAEMIRDQALAVSGLLSPKLYGPPVKPPQPKLGLSAAFGSGTDWETSMGEDRYRRGLYTTWRRSNPYPSMATFDAPNREVCLVRRERSNTPLQALVTLNDPVYVEAAQALARRMVRAGTTPPDRARHGFRLCLTRSPSEAELDGLVGLYSRALDKYRSDPARAREMATQPLGDLPEGMDAVDLAAWTVVGNVLLNLDETLMRR